jgi:ferritin-like metal-binding protein YciE
VLAFEISGEFRWLSFHNNLTRIANERISTMPVNNPKEVFVLMLSNVRQGAERTSKFFQELSQVAQDPDIKEVLEARVYVNDKILATLDQCFKLIGEQPVKTTGRLQEVFIEDFKRELGEIQSPVAKHLFILSKAIHLIHLRIGEYVALTAAADLTGHYAVGTLLETCLADKLAMAERTRRLLRRVIEIRVAERKAA